MSSAFIPLVEDVRSRRVPSYEEAERVIGKPYQKIEKGDTSTYERDVIGLHKEIKNFYSNIQPTPESHQLRLNVLERASNVIKSLWPDAEVEPFGSFATGLYLPTSDMDIVILGRWEVLPLRTMERNLISIAVPGSVEVIEATHPIVKYLDVESEISVDISFNSLSGPKAAQLIKIFKQQFPVLPELVSIIKQFLLERDLARVYTGGLSSYSVTILVISFLQLHPRCDPSSDNLGVLLLELLHLYGYDFNYDCLAVSIRDGGQLLSKRDLIMVDNINNRWTDVQSFAIEDPLQPFKDIAKGTFNAQIIKKAFAFAHRRLVKRVRNGSGMLESIITL